MTQTEKKQFEELQQKLAAALENADEVLKAENAELAAKLEAVEQKAGDIQETVDNQAALIEEQAKQLAAYSEIAPAAEAATSKLAVPQEPVTVDGKQYTWLKAKFRVLGDPELHTAEEAAQDAALLKRIVAIEGQKLLKPVV